MTRNLRTSHRVSLTIGGALAGAVLALGGLAGCSSGGAKTVDVTLGDYVVQPKPVSVSAGDISFKVHNAGGFEHEMVVMKLNAASAIPKKADGSADEDAVPEAAHMGEVEHVKPGATKSWKVKLDAGTYVLFCNQETNGVQHFAKGMSTTFTVTA